MFIDENSTYTYIQSLVYVQFFNSVETPILLRIKIRIFQLNKLKMIKNIEFTDFCSIFGRIYQCLAMNVAFTTH